ncbi:MAG TPA: C25 family cysteine peptidase, partial [Chryseosolibacter sp.]|nr:C25 family cysteine peptidase [Chryseosolibacter sp.]
GITPETHHQAEVLLLLTNNYSVGRDYGDIVSSSFDDGEGFMGTRLLQNESEIYTVEGISRSVQTAGKPQLEIMVTGRGPMQHMAEISVGTSLRLLTSVSVNGYSSQKINHEIEWSDIASDGTLQVRVAVKIADETSARLSANYIQVRYPQALDMDAKDHYWFNIDERADSRAVVNIENASTGTRLFDITDPETVVEIQTTMSSTLDAVIPTDGTTRKLLAIGKPIIPSMQVVTFRNISPSNHDYVIVTHPTLRRPALTYTDPVEAYASYRASEAGGAYDTLIVNIGELYDQFNYGEKSPLAIFHFIKFLAATKLPSYLFIIGKGLDANYNAYRDQAQWAGYHFVPSGGMPGSDFIFSAGLAGEPNVHAIPTGRLTATSSNDVAAYLNKVVEKEALPFDNLRRKNILHLSGGVYQNEPQAFRSYLEDFGRTAKAGYFGGRVQAVAKQSTDIKLINIAKEVNEGLGFITFFGHSSATTLDFDVGFVSDPVMGYNNNAGKYPILLMNGCDVGKFFLNTKIFGEDWVNSANRGAVGFIGHSSFGFISALWRFSGHFYETAFADSVLLAKGIGDIQLETSRRYMADPDVDPLHPRNITQVQQMVLLGDPAVPLFGAQRPDYAILDENVSLHALDDKPVTIFSDSFAIDFIVRNYGQARPKPFNVRIVRQFNGNTVSYDSTYQPVYYSDTIRFIIRGNDPHFAGVNTFEVRIDADNSIEELSEGNNTAYLDHFIATNSTKNLYPTDFSIVSSVEPDLSFQHTDILSGEKIFDVEIDTIPTFDSQWKKTYSVTTTVLGKQKVTLLGNDSTTYYWRTRIANPSANESAEWTKVSFTYIDDGPDGWMQKHFPQFGTNTFDALLADNTARTFAFDETKTEVLIHTFGGDASARLNDVSVKLNDAEYHLRQQGFGCRNNTLNLIAFDKTSTVPYLGIVLNWQNRAGRTCGREPWVINSFRPAEMVTGNNDDLIKYIDNIASGDSVVLFTIGNAAFSTWPSEAKQKLSEIGLAASQIESLVDGEPIVILARKGASAGSAQVVRHTDEEAHTEPLHVDGSVTGSVGYGEMTSNIIGPAERWNNISFKVEKETADEVLIDVYGISVDKQAFLLLSDLTAATDLSSIDASEHPNLKLVFKTKDESNLSPAHLKMWTVNYTPVPEGLIFYKGDRFMQTLQEGETWFGEFSFINVSNTDFPDSVSVEYDVFNHESLQSKTHVVKISPPSAGDTTLFSIPVETVGITGINDIRVFVNPYLQREAYYDNNLFSLPGHISVAGERFNPVIDVTIDGRYISNGDYVSISPEINFTMWDENPFLLKGDTTGVELLLAYPCIDETCPFTRVNFSSEKVTWTKATSSNPFNVVYQPEELPDGSYVLRIETSDKAGNTSPNPFEVSFKVLREKNTLVATPYPNPTNGVLKFNFDVTGDTPPTQAILQIISARGELLGTFAFDSFHVGANQRSLNLEGLGLVNGLYLYKMTIFHDSKQYQSEGRFVLTR